MKRALLGTLVCGSVIALAAPMVAHHSISSEFDTTKSISFSGKIVRVDFGNPHIYTHVETTEAGKTVIYKVEGGSPNDLVRQGFSKNSVKVGEPVTVTGIRAKSPTSMNIGQARILKADGSRVY